MQPKTKKTNERRKTVHEKRRHCCRWTSPFRSRPRCVSGRRSRFCASARKTIRSGSVGRRHNENRRHCSYCYCRPRCRRGWEGGGPDSMRAPRSLRYRVLFGLDDVCALPACFVWSKEKPKKPQQNTENERANQKGRRLGQLFCPVSSSFFFELLFTEFLVWMI